MKHKLTIMEYQEQRKIVKTMVEKFMNQNKNRVPNKFWDKYYWDHILNTGTSILCYKWEIGPEPGSFVKAVVDNDLMGAVGRADYINESCLKAYCSMIYNIDKPSTL